MPHGKIVEIEVVLPLRASAFVGDSNIALANAERQLRHQGQVKSDLRRQDEVMPDIHRVQAILLGRDRDRAGERFGQLGAAADQPHRIKYRQLTRR